MSIYLTMLGLYYLYFDKLECVSAINLMQDAYKFAFWNLDDPLSFLEKWIACYVLKIRVSPMSPQCDVSNDIQRKHSSTYIVSYRAWMVLE